MYLQTRTRGDLVGLFSGLEDNLEKYIEGFFRGKLKGKIQPVDIAKRLAREMRDKKRVSVNLVYAPNDYTVFLSQEDWRVMESISGALAKELQEYLALKAQEKDYTLVAKPTVTLCGDNELSPGQMRLASGFADMDLTGQIGGRTEEGTYEDTLCFKPLRDTSPVLAVKQQQKFYLVVQDGLQKGRRYELNGLLLIIGRRESCDVALSDSSISRRHAQLELLEGTWVLTDLGSTNGTYVNGSRIHTQEVVAGDAIKFGSILCLLKVE